jgi:hypothetical protein
MAVGLSQSEQFVVKGTLQQLHFQRLLQYPVYDSAVKDQRGAI